MKKRLPHRIGKIVSWTLGVLIFLIVLLPFALYIPWVQEKAKDIACHYVKEKTGMDLSIGRILIKFPLDLSLDDMVLLDQKGDTMVAAKNFTAGVAVKPLFDKRFEIDGAELVEGKYRMVSEDSSMVLRADVRHCKLTGTDIDLENNKINVLDGELTGGKVHLAMFPYKKIEEPDSTDKKDSKPWLIQAKHLTLNDVDYTMEMNPTIDNLTTHLARAELKDGVVDTGMHSVDVGYLNVDSVDCRYTYPSKAWAEKFNREHPLPPEIYDPNKDTIPWTIKGDSLRVNGAHVVYALKDKKPSRGLDTDYIEVSDLNLEVNDFYNRGPIVMVPLQNLTAKERSGLEIKEAHGTAKVNSQDIQLENFVLKTKNSSFEVDGSVDQSMFTGNDHNGSVKLKTNSSVDLRELGTAIPSLASVTKAIPSNRPIKVKGTFEGNTRDIDIKNGSLEIPGHIKATMGGNIKNVTDPKKIQANVSFDADIDNVEFAKKEFLSKDVQKQFNLVPMKLKGNVQYKPGQIGGDIDMRLKSGGSLVGSGSYNLNNENYTIDATAKSFPVKKIVPGVDVNNVTAHIKGSGHGFDFLGKNTAVNAQVQLTDIDYAGKHYRNLDADVKLNGQNFDAKVNARNRGTMAAKGSYDLKRNKYDIDATLNNFPVDEFVPEYEIGKVTARVKAKGENFDFLKKNTWMNADVDLTSIEYKDQVFTDLKGNVRLDGNQFDGRIDSKIPNCDAYADFSGSVNGNTYTIDLEGNVRGLDLQALNVLDIPCDGQGNIDLHGTFNLEEMTYNADLCLSDLNWNYNDEYIFSEQTCLKLNADEGSTSVNYADNDSNSIKFTSPNSIMGLVDGISGFLDRIEYQRKNKDLNVNELVNELPAFDLDMKMGANGLLQRFLGRWDVDFREINAEITNDGDPMSGINSLHGQINANSLSMGDKAIDTLQFNINQQDDIIGFTGRMRNNKGTWDEMASVDLEGFATGSTVNMTLDQKNIKNQTGYNVGLNADIANAIIDVNFLDNPTIAYRKWSVNDSNFVRLNLGDKLLEANLKLKSDSSLVYLYTDSIKAGHRQNILVDIDNLIIEEWTNMIPSLSDMSGVLNADMTLTFDEKTKNLLGNGDVKLSKFRYSEVMQPTDMNMTAELTIDPETSATRLDAILNMDGSEVAVAYGNLNDSTSTSPLNLGITMTRFPLEKVSPFIPGKMVLLKGYANGDVILNGNMDAPLINGKIVGDSAFVTLPRYGSSLELCKDPIEIEDNTIEFKNYKLKGLNDNAAKINGFVDFSSLDNIKMNLDVKGNNIQFFNSKQKSYSEIFGKGFIDIDGKLRSSNNLTAINADAKLLKGSDITYVMQDEINSMSNSSATKGMVTFINPNDPQMGGDSIIIVGGSAASALNILVDVDIENGAKINAFLQPEGRDRVNINGEGSLRYSIDFAGKDDLHGTYTIESGVFRYTPPVLTQKVFNIVEGSSLTWNGDMLNPQLNLQGTNKVRTSVPNETGNGTRLVDFDITAMLKNTLSNIDLKFDLEAKNDAAIESELQTLTDTQRSQAAINLLLYNSYSGSKTTGDLSTTGALFSFLQSQINSWAANNLKGIDVSFGINQYEGSSEAGGRTETSYSYHLSKSLFDDRFKIAIGGEYSTEAKDESSFSENLINDISFEYLLTPTGSRYLRLFRHKGIESVLEGEVTITGISFVMKHKLSSLGEMFKWLRRKPSTQAPLEQNPQLESPTINNVNDTP